MTMSVIDVTRGRRECFLAEKAAKVMRDGGVIAYPTESCFGLGCDPNNALAVRRLLAIKCRSYRKGLILIVSNIQQCKEYAKIQKSPKHAEILDSWPGPNTWLLPPTHKALRLVRGQHEQIAIRMTAHPIAAAICEVFGGAIVSTSANLQRKASLKTADSVQRQFGHSLDFIVSACVGIDDKPSIIRNGLSGEILRK